MTPATRPFWSPFSAEFQCRGCGAHQAYRSRPRGFFEAYILPVFFLQPVRCDRCYLRSYVPRSVPAPQRPQHERGLPKAQSSGVSDRTSRIA